MSIVKFLSSLLYNAPANKLSLNNINEKLNGYQKTLEKLGFETKLADQTFYFTPAQLLTATRDNFTLAVILDVTGFEHVSLSLDNKGYSIPVHLADFDHALTIVGVQETAASAKEKKVA